MPAGSALQNWTDPLTGRIIPIIGAGYIPPPDVIARMPQDLQDWFRQRQEFRDISSVRHPGAGTGQGWANQNWLRLPLSTPAGAAPTPPSAAIPTPQLPAPTPVQTTQTTQQPSQSLAQLLGQTQAAPPATIGRLPSGPSEIRQGQPQQVSPLMQMFNFPTLRTKKPAQATGGVAPMGAGQYNENFWNTWRL